MTPVVIILILIGLGIIIFSCFLVDKSNQDVAAYEGITLPKELTISEMEDIKRKIEVLVSEITENTLERTEDKLSQLSNEKIIAVSDFSNQVIEKISQNHEEVIFLYNMLNEKETELKDILKNIDVIKNQVKSQIKEIDSKGPVTGDNKTKTKVQAIQDNNNDKSNSNKTDEKVNQNSLNQNAQNQKSDFFNNNNNQKILELYSQGFTVIDIAKMLELGQGEVKLVIDLYNQK